MFARFNLKTNKDFDRIEDLSKISNHKGLDYLAEYSLALDEWQDIKINIPDSVRFGNRGLNYYMIGKEIYRNLKTRIYDSLDKYIGVNGVINGNMLQADWFPDINAHIFLSHSHKDEQLAIKFAGWLFYNFKLVTFIDSCVWGYSDKLLRKIDYRYCSNGYGAYSYEKRNISTTHVHMMLMNALMKMIDKSESVFFLNTDNSTITTGEEITRNMEKTYSPWIYSEINATNLIRKKRLIPERRNTKNILEILNESSNINELLIDYDVDLSEMYYIDDKILNLWQERSFINKRDFRATDALDQLYKLVIES